MPTFDLSTLSDLAIAHKKGMTLQQGRALRDNLLSVAEGGPNAIMNQAFWHPYDMTNVGDGNKGIVWDQAVDGNFTVIVLPASAFAPGYEYRCVGQGLRPIQPTAVSEGVVLEFLVGGVWGNAVPFVNWAQGVVTPKAVDVAYDPMKVGVAGSGQYINNPTGVRLRRSNETITGSTIRVLRRRTLADFT